MTSLRYSWNRDSCTIFVKKSPFAQCWYLHFWTPFYADFSPKRSNLVFDVPGQLTRATIALINSPVIEHRSAVGFNRKEIILTFLDELKRRTLLPTLFKRGFLR